MLDVRAQLQLHPEGPRRSLGRWILGNLTFTTGGGRTRDLIVDQAVALSDSRMLWGMPAGASLADYRFTSGVPVGDDAVTAALALGGLSALDAFMAFNHFREEWWPAWRDFLDTGEWWRLLWDASWARWGDRYVQFTATASREAVLIDILVPGRVYAASSPFMHARNYGDPGDSMLTFACARGARLLGLDPLARGPIDDDDRLAFIRLAPRTMWRGLP